MTLRRKGIYDTVDSSHRDTRIEISPEEEKEITKVAVQEIKDMLKDIYDSMYPKESR
ncbi:hypothetical protein [Streptococcus oricebi]|nr:hypothetical protein [Streptococcus oricebi]